MKRRIAVSIALALSVVFVLLSSSDSTTHAQQRVRFRADTGVVKLGLNQVLRVTVVGDYNGDGDIRVRFRRIDYAQGPCNGGVCKLGSVTDLVIDPFMLMPGEAASIVADNVAPDASTRVIVESNRRNVRATASIINTQTGETTSHIIIANTEGDFH